MYPRPFRSAIPPVPTFDSNVTSGTPHVVVRTQMLWSKRKFGPERYGEPEMSEPDFACVASNVDIRRYSVQLQSRALPSQCWKSEGRRCTRTYTSIICYGNSLYGSLAFPPPTCMVRLACCKSNARSGAHTSWLVLIGFGVCR